MHTGLGSRKMHTGLGSRKMHPQNQGSRRLAMTRATRLHTLLCFTGALMSSGEVPNLPDLVWTLIANFLIKSLLAEVRAKTTRRHQMLAEENVRPALFGPDRVFYVCRNFEDETTASLVALQWRLRQCRILEVEDNHPSNSCFELTALFPPAECEFDYAFIMEDAEMVSEYNWLALLRAEVAVLVEGRQMRDYGRMLEPFCVVCKSKWRLQQLLRLQLEGAVGFAHENPKVLFHELGTVVSNTQLYILNTENALSNVSFRRRTHG
jgi:hypothetical protein